MTRLREYQAEQDKDNITVQVRVPCSGACQHHNEKKQIQFCAETVGIEKSPEVVYAVTSSIGFAVQEISGGTTKNVVSILPMWTLNFGVTRE